MIRPRSNEKENTMLSRTNYLTFMIEDRFTSVSEDLPIAQWYITLRAHKNSRDLPRAMRPREYLCHFLFRDKVKCLATGWSKIKPFEQWLLPNASWSWQNSWNKSLKFCVFESAQRFPNQTLENGTPRQCTSLGARWSADFPSVFSNGASPTAQARWPGHACAWAQVPSCSAQGPHPWPPCERVWNALHLWCEKKAEIFDICTTQSGNR